MDLDRIHLNGALFPEQPTVCEQLSRMLSQHDVMNGIEFLDHLIGPLCWTHPLFKEDSQLNAQFIKSLAWPTPEHDASQLCRSLNSDTKRYRLFLLH
jgi:hypothetical protein